MQVVKYVLKSHIKYLSILAMYISQYTFYYFVYILYKHIPIGTSIVKRQTSVRITEVVLELKYEYLCILN